MDVHDLTAAYALDALDAEERDAYEEHLAQCERCRLELAELGEAAGALAFAAAAPAPPDALRGRILDAAAAERRNVVSLPVRPRWLAAVAAVAACAAVGFGVWSAVLSSSLDSERSARAAEQRAMQIYLDPGARRVPLANASGTLAVDATGQGALVVRRLPAAPSGKTYEAWVIPRGAKPIRAGLFAGGDTTTLLALQTAVPEGAVVAATVEPGGGSDAPTTAPLFTARA